MKLGENGESCYHGSRFCGEALSCNNDSLSRTSTSWDPCHALFGVSVVALGSKCVLHKDVYMKRSAIFKARDAFLFVPVTDRQTDSQSARQ